MARLNHQEKAARHLVLAAHHLLHAREALQAGNHLKALYHADLAEEQVQFAETLQTYMQRIEKTENITLIC